MMREQSLLFNSFSSTHTHTYNTMAPKKSTKKSYFGKKSNLSESEEEYEGPLNLLLAKKPFKNPNYKTVKKNKNLKQILTMERDKVYALDVPTYENIECAPSVLPQKKYCDITGLNAKYTDPKTGLRYHNAEIYQFIRTLGVPNVQAYLASRNAAVVLK
ncbi:YL1 nuclear protein C-terminal domain-containing protein [Mucor lusitanicus]|uniref:YL1 nuclear protein C-terminal domain-containing protein n=1 Tax=Mucor circinelloides f. lusitanicus TaxID=29924 RepID=A0A8H4B853_MUCCL|nr:YL1 nuclear protein C-terminal domain-containing protein [Mucor lusitanicus]